MTYPVKWFSEEMAGAPVMMTDTTGTAGTLVALLKACLISGFNLKAIATLTFDSGTNTGTATFATAHGYKANTVISIDGTGDPAWDGEHRITTLSSQSITFEMLTIPVSNLTGSGSCKVAPVDGWAIEFADSLEQIVIFKRTDEDATPLRLRIDNSAWSGWYGGATYPYWLAKVQLVEDVVDINNYTVVKTHYWPAAHTYAASAQWDLVADSKLFYFLPRYSVASKACVLAFGDINTIRQDDNYHCILTGIPPHSATSQYKWSVVYNASSYGWDIYNDFLKFGVDSVRSYGGSSAYFKKLFTIARPYHQLPGAEDCTLLGVGPAFGMGVAFPNGSDNGFYVNDGAVPVLELTTNNLRGYMPGLVAPYQNDSRLYRYAVNIDASNPNKLVRFLLATASLDQNSNPIETTTYNNLLNVPVSYRLTERLCGFDITGPWR